MPAGAGNPPNIKMEPPKSNFNIREGGGRFFGVKGLIVSITLFSWSTLPSSPHGYHRHHRHHRTITVIILMIIITIA